MILEGVPYRRYVVTFCLADGRRRRWIRWAPAELYMREALARELVDRGISPEDIRPRSCRIHEA